MTHDLLLRAHPARLIRSHPFARLVSARCLYASPTMATWRLEISEGIGPLRWPVVGTWCVSTDRATFRGRAGRWPIYACRHRDGRVEALAGLPGAAFVIRWTWRVAALR